MKGENNYIKDMDPNIIIDDKKYWLEKKNWFSENKRGTIYTVGGKNILDKLWNEYNLGKQKLKVGGVGDVISKITSTLGIGDDDCPDCKRRKKYLNKFSWLRKSRDLTEDEEEFVIDLKSRKQMSGKEQKRLFELYNVITRSKIKLCHCSGLVLKMLERLENFIVIIKTD